MSTNFQNKTICFIPAQYANQGGCVGWEGLDGPPSPIPLILMKQGSPSNPQPPTKENIPEYINPELFTYVLYLSSMHSLKSK